MIKFIISIFKTAKKIVIGVFSRDSNSDKDKDPFGQDDFKYPLF